MCKYCEPYKEKFIHGENGYACITKYGELVVFPKADFKVRAVHLKINFCPMCGRKLSEEKTKRIKYSFINIGKLIILPFLLIWEVTKMLWELLTESPEETEERVRRILHDENIFGR